MKTNPLTHQKNILSIFNTSNNYAFLWEMGLGKTWLGCFVIEQQFSFEKKYLILCPNTVVDVWYNEFLKHTTIEEQCFCILKGSKEKRIQLLKKHPICILNYEGLLVLQSELSTYNFDVIIADESHKLKNLKALQTKIAVKLKGIKKFIMTGTPIAKNYLDIFSQWLFMDGGQTFGSSFYAFRSKYFIDSNLGKFRNGFPLWKLKPEVEKQLNILLAKNSHRLEKTDVLDLPQKIYMDKYCELSKEQEKTYLELKNECITWLNDNVVTAQVALTKFIRLTQITSGFLKTEAGKEICFLTNPKIELCKELVEEILERPNNKIIIWAHYVKDIKLLLKTFEQYNPAVVFGEIKDKKEQVDTFQNNTNCKIFIAQFQSASEGITLTAANYAIRYSYDFNYLTWKQAEDRCHRKGSEIHQSITYINLVAKNTIDEYILKSLQNKNTNSNDILSFIKNKNI